MTSHPTVDPGSDLDAILDLEAPAARLPIAPGDLRHVVASGRRRQRRRQGALALLAAVSVVGAGSITIARSADDEQRTEVRTAGAGRRGDVPMSWSTVDPSSGLGFSRDLGGQPGATPLYALSTAAGRADNASSNPKRVVWRSDDGIDWTAASTLGPDLYLADLDTDGTRLYAVGTGTATAGGRKLPPVFVGWSDDGASTWERAGLDVDLAAIEAVSASAAVAASDVATAASGTFAVVVVSAQLDVRKVLPDGVTAPHGWASTATGIDLLRDGEPTCADGRADSRTEVGGDERGVPAEVHAVSCFDGDRFTGTLTPQEAHGVAASYTWDELGITGDALRAVLRQPIGYFAPDGSTSFERTDLGIAVTTYDVMLEAVGDGFDLAVTSPKADRMEGSVVSLRHSDDGRTWSPSSAPTGLEWVTAMGRIDGRPALIGQSRSGGVLSLSNGDGTWSTTALTGLVDPALTEDATAHVSSADIGPFGAVVAVVVVDDGEKPSDLRPRLLVTHDGSTWSDVDVAEVSGRPTTSVTRVLVAGDRVLVTASVTPPGSGRPAQVVLLGSPG